MDRLIGAVDSALRTLFATPRAARGCPVVPAEETHLGAAERGHAAGLMRVNHVGEVCAQALYTAQALATRDPLLRRHLEQAAREETDHLAWTQGRLEELGSRPSLLNPLWYAGAFGLGLVAGRFGDPVSLGFVVETERQVEAHLQDHLARLPERDLRSRAIVEQMKADEMRHANTAVRYGARELPAPVKLAMKLSSKLMTRLSYVA